MPSFHAASQPASQWMRLPCTFQIELAMAADRARSSDLTEAFTVECTEYWYLYCRATMIHVLEDDQRMMRSSTAETSTMTARQLSAPSYSQPGLIIGTEYDGKTSLHTCTVQLRVESDGDSGTTKGLCFRDLGPNSERIKHHRPSTLWNVNTASPETRKLLLRFDAICCLFLFLFFLPSPPSTPQAAALRLSRETDLPLSCNIGASSRGPVFFTEWRCPLLTPCSYTSINNMRILAHTVRRGPPILTVFPLLHTTNSGTPFNQHSALFKPEPIREVYFAGAWYEDLVHTYLQAWVSPGGGVSQTNGRMPCC
ncbi:hypothetical protein J3F83DRAFT_77307 [Trichoderma novae-zelandiae]